MLSLQLLIMLIQDYKAQNRRNHYDKNYPKQLFTWKAQINLPSDITHKLLPKQIWS